MWNFRKTIKENFVGLSSNVYRWTTINDKQKEICNSQPMLPMYIYEKILSTRLPSNFSNNLWIVKCDRSPLICHCTISWREKQPITDVTIVARKKILANTPTTRQVWPNRSNWYYLLLTSLINSLNSLRLPCIFVVEYRVCVHILQKNLTQN